VSAIGRRTRARFSTVIENFGIAPEVNFLDAQDYRASSTRVEAIGI
jgi:hypothetical protein